MTEERDPRHQTIIDLVIAYRDGGHDDKADELKKRAAELQTERELNILANTCSQLLNWIDK